MFFYDFLFYAAYKQGIKSRNYSDIPILGGIFPVAFCLASNLTSLYVIVIKLFHIESYHIGTFPKIIFGFLFVGLLYFYYRYNERYRRIIEKYDRKRKSSRFYDLPYVLVLFMYIAIAALILATIAYFFVYKNIQN